MSSVQREFGAWMNRVRYTVGNKPIKRKHCGQLKLLISEIEFLTETVPLLNDKDKDIIVVYAGAADGYHIPFLMDLFPTITEWHLWDPEPFALNVRRRSREKRYSVFLYNDMFTDQCALRIGRQNRQSVNKQVLFISDIRSDAYDDEAIARDMRNQFNWAHDMCASHSMLKFRLPFPSDSNKESSNKESFIYPMCNSIRLQVFAPVNSTETRAFFGSVCNDNVKLTDYDINEYEERMAWFNREVREGCDYDIKATIQILQSYVQVFGEGFDHRRWRGSAKELLKEITRFMNVDLQVGIGHMHACSESTHKKMRR